jgi:hypothetical protein
MKGMQLKTEALVITLIVAAVSLSGAGALYHYHNSNYPASGPTSFYGAGNGGSTWGIATQADGLELFMNITPVITNANVTELEYLLVNISIFNPMPYNVTVAAAQDWPVNGLALGPCGTGNYPMGIAVYRGYYTASNISSAGTPLELYEPGVYACPMILLLIRNYTFPAYGAVGQNWTYNNGTINTGTYSLSYFMNITGYYGKTSILSGNSFSYFLTGPYTVVGASEWGQMVILHFNGTQMILG